MTIYQQQNDISWLDENFGGIDLSAFPSLQAPPTKPKDDGRFARSWQDSDYSRSASALRSFVNAPDAEALERAGNETGNQHFLADVRDQRAEAIVLKFKFANPDYLPTDSNYRAMVATIAYNSDLPPSEQRGDINDVADRLIARGFWTVENLTRVFGALRREGMLELPAGATRNLSESERLRVTRLAQNGRVDEAIGQYLKFALVDEEPSLELISDPTYRDVCDEGVTFVWESATADYAPTDERRAYMERYTAGRPLTIHLLNAAWAECQRNERRVDRDELIASFEPTPPTANDIDELPDGDIDSLYRESLRAARHAPGILA